ncbi:flagellar hook-associated protein FlgK [Amaricoccus sp.]|uniref:flagellar hook-associated protein FlgK n=1 Tax=Amaricoccus sp. TaxID=1872485 RepID=UPI001B654487|nr:flagellar hook-associated protein FlgK [Amaricoccus sp.]MBP7003741.1 flagellar hook-associated protein FlgK [Amaricoccus sp.]
MGISNALNNAYTGLVGASRLADTVSNNVANAMTPGFGRRVTELSSLALGGYGSGVRVTGTYRTENAFVTAERRAMDAATGAATTTSGAYLRIVDALGEPGEAGALATRASGLETKLMAAVASPQSLTGLTDAVTAARQLAEAVNGVAAENQRLRTEADAEIARQVGQVNDALKSVKDLNDKITTLQMKGEDVSGLQDERDRVIDGISSIVPVRVVNRDNGQVALYSANGGALLDGRVWELSFQQGPNVITADMTLGAPLGGLMQDQGAAGPTAVAAGTGTGAFDGGSLGALFEIRDKIVPGVDAEMDRYAAELIDRFQSLAAAGSLDASGDGLFVDAAGTGGVGLAGRLKVNAAVDPNQGGAAWRLRDGLSATAPGAEGFGDYLQGLADAMSTARAPGGWTTQNAANDAATMASEIASFFAGRSATAEDTQAYLAARQTTLADSEANAIGVDTDKELQNLILIEQAYAANARVLATIDDLLKLLLE